MARTAGAYLDEYLNNIPTLASALVVHPAVDGLDSGAALPLFTSLKAQHPMLAAITLVDSSGRVIASAVPGASDEHPPAWFRGATVKESPQVSGLVTDPASGTSMVTFSYPVRSVRRDGGVLGLTIDMTRLQGMLAAVPLPSGSVISVTDTNGVMLLRSIEPVRYVGRAAIPAPTTSLGYREDVDGIERFHEEFALTRAPWTLTVGIPRDQVLERLRGLWIRNVVVSGGAFLGLLLVALWLASTMAAHLDQLQRAAQRIADGDLVAALPGETAATKELADLRRTFGAMAQNLKQTRATLDKQFDQERSMNDALQSLQRQVVRQERLAAVGLLASGLAHELNNPLQAIVGVCQLLERSAPSEVQPEIDVVKVQSARAVAIIRSLSRFGNHHQSAPELIHPAEVVDDVARLRAPEPGRPAIAVKVSSKPGRRVSANFAELEQVVLNFVTNAQEAVASLPEDDRRVEVCVTDVARWIRVEVRDNGPGVSPDDEAKLFQPFFTTKSVGKGTGLGLSVSYGIIQSHGGAIGYVRNEWGGATFFFELPVVESDAMMGHDDQAVLRRPL